MKLKAPFPYFGGKSKVASEVWKRFGELQNYVEPFAGSAAMLLRRPRYTVSSPNHEFDWGIETINDADGLVSNFWRALQHAPEELINHANWPVNEADLHARHLWLVRTKEDLTSKLMADPEWYDPKAAGWWVWGACAWIGQGWCRGYGPWTEVDGVFVNKNDLDTDAGDEGVNRQIPHLNRSQGINRQIPHLSGGRGINRHVESPQEVKDKFDIGGVRLEAHLLPLARRLRDVRVACGDWSRVLGSSPTYRLGITGVFLDPPYSEGTVDYNAGDRSVAAEVLEWCKETGDHPKMRIALCGYDGEHNDLEEMGWSVFEWKTSGGYGNQGEKEGRDNAKRERIWFSPNCHDPDAVVEEVGFGDLFG